MIWNAQADLKNSSNHKKTVSQESLNINKWNHKILYPYTYIQYTYTKHSHEGMRTGTPENGCCFSASKLYLEEANQKIKADTVPWQVSWEQVTEIQPITKAHSRDFRPRWNEAKIQKQLFIIHGGDTGSKSSRMVVWGVTIPG